MTEPTIGARVKITSNALGAISKDGPATGFVERTFGKGDELTIVLRLPRMGERDDWYALEPDDDATIYVPAHVSMFELVEGSST